MKITMTVMAILVTRLKTSSFLCGCQVAYSHYLSLIYEYYPLLLFRELSIIPCLSTALPLSAPYQPSLIVYITIIDLNRGIVPRAVCAWQGLPDCEGRQEVVVLTAAHDGTDIVFCPLESCL